MPNIEILWSTAFGGRTFASRGVFLGPDGTASFTFLAPAEAAGLPITVELVAW
jgi:hypothetical protein